MLFAMLQRFERYASDELPPPHRLVLIVLASLADERAHARLDVAAVAAVAKRTGLGVREVKTVLAELHAAVWIEREPHQKATSHIFVVRLEGGRIVRRRHDAPVPPGENASDAPRSEVLDAPAAPRRLGAEGGAQPKAPLTMTALVERRPAADLLKVLNRGAEDGHPWCESTLQRVLERGGYLTERERARLREIRDEITTERAPSRRRYTGASTLQTGGTWKPKGAPP